jgi:hypothetical protein
MRESYNSMETNRQPGVIRQYWTRATVDCSGETFDNRYATEQEATFAAKLGSRIIAGEVDVMDGANVLATYRYGVLVS